mmetsp:Transcript_11743/g.26792  ORF Transcript_11743/g.26792 Transcript_11743/m.26792 type:complete len:622 (-) Transcript_11743:128-1993(-)
MLRFALAVLLNAEAWAHPDDGQTLVQQAYHSRGSTMPTMDEKQAHEESVKTSLLEGLKQGDLPWTVDGVRTSLNRSMQKLQIIHDSVEDVMNSYKAGDGSMEGPVVEVIKQLGKDVSASDVKDLFKETRQRLGQVMDDISAEIPSLLALANQQRRDIDRVKLNKALGEMKESKRFYAYLWMFSIIPAVAFTTWHEGFSVSVSLPIYAGREFFMPGDFGGPYDDFFTEPYVSLNFPKATVSMFLDYPGYSYDRLLEHLARGSRGDVDFWSCAGVSVRMNTNYESAYGSEVGTDWFLDWSFSFNAGIRFNPALRGIAVLADDGEKVQEAAVVKGGRPGNVQWNFYMGLRWPFKNFSDYSTSFGSSISLGGYVNRFRNKQRSVKGSVTLVWGQNTMTQTPKGKNLELLREGRISLNQSREIWEKLFPTVDDKEKIAMRELIPVGVGLSFATWKDGPLAPSIQEKLASTVQVEESTRKLLLELCERSNEIGVARADRVPETLAAKLDDDETDLNEIKLHQEDVLARQVKLDVTMATPSFPVDCWAVFPREQTKKEAWDTCVKYIGQLNCGVAKATWLKEESITQIVEWTPKEETFDSFSYEKEKTEKEDKKVEEDKKEEVKVEER